MAKGYILSKEFLMDIKMYKNLKYIYLVKFPTQKKQWTEKRNLRQTL